MHQATPRDTSTPFVNKQVLGGETYILFGETESLESTAGLSQKVKQELYKIVEIVTVACLRTSQPGSFIRSTEAHWRFLWYTTPTGLTNRGSEVTVLLGQQQQLSFPDRSRIRDKFSGLWAPCKESWECLQTSGAAQPLQGTYRWFPGPEDACRDIQ